MHTDVLTAAHTETAKMMVVLPDEERRLITFTLPSESCTVVELLEQVGIKLTPNMQVRCIALSDEELDYVVTITEEKPIVHQMVQVGGMMASSPGLQALQLNQKKLPAPAMATQSQHTAKYVDGFVAICESCGFLSMDHAKCERCHRILNDPQRRPMRAQPPTPKPTPVTLTGRSLVGSGTPVRLTSPSKAKRGGASTRGTLAARGRATVLRTGKTLVRMKKVEEPVVLTLSSDDEGEEEPAKTPPARYPFEPVYVKDEGGAGDSSEMSGELTKI